MKNKAMYLVGFFVLVTVAHATFTDQSNPRTTAGTSGTVSVSNFPATQPISGAVSVSNFPATQPVSGTFWQATQPVSGTVTANTGLTQPLTDVQLRASPVPVSGTFWQATQPVSGSVSVSNFPATQPVSIATMPSTPVTGTFWQATQPVSGPLTDTQLRATPVPVSGTLTVNTGLTDTQLRATAVPISGTVTANTGLTQPITDTQIRATPLPVSGTVTANTGLTQPLTDTQLRASAVPVSGTFFQATQPVSGSVSVSNFPASQAVVGNKTQNSSTPSTDSVAIVDAIANADTPSKTEGTLSNLSVDLNGNLRVNQKPIPALGVYSVAMTTNTYAGLAANKELMSMRWGDATRLCVILKVQVNVMTTVAASTAGITERQLIVARSWTVSDSNGTAVSFTGNNQKRRTSMGSSLVTDMRFGSAITAGTRTLDALPISAAVAWSPLNMTGITIGGVGGVATSAANSVAGGMDGVSLLDATNGTESPIVLAQNEGIIVRLGAIEPSGATQQTIINITWAEVNKY